MPNYTLSELWLSSSFAASTTYKMGSEEPTSTSIRDERAYSAIQQLQSFSSHQPTCTLPLTSAERLSSSSEVKSILYLAYGSNLSAETFRGNRGIRPLSSVNVHVPCLTLTFDLAGIAYLEPCFANTAYRIPPPGQAPFPQDPKYRKNRWQKGLVGVLYEVTPSDYRTIIATEGGGSSYQDIVVPCFPLAAGLEKTPEEPESQPVLAHTLMCPRDGDRLVRPDPGYAQPSHRYLKLITDGAEEHGLPGDYMAYLSGIRGFTITMSRQKVGRALFLGMWLPWIVSVMGPGRLLADKEGRVPEWYARAMGLLFEVMWRSYDFGFKRFWGDGERTVGEVEDEEIGKKGEIWLP